MYVDKGCLIMKCLSVLSVLNIYTTSAQHKRSASGRDSAMLRDSQLGMLQKDAFVAYLKKIKVTLNYFNADKVLIKKLRQYHL